jgi:hypothetical protein
MGLELKISQVTNSPLANGIGYTSAYDLKELSIFIKSLSMLTIHDCVYPFVTRFQEFFWKNKEIKIRVFYVYHEPKVW